MTVYVDELKTYPASVVAPAARQYGYLWCHMYADDEDELHRFARKIGLRRQYFQEHRYPHYDLTPGKRELALENGAVEITSKEWVRKHGGA